MRDGDTCLEYQIGLDDVPCCWRRFTEFSDLRDQLSSLPSLERFPPKRLFNTKHVVDERCLGLQRWLASQLDQVNPTRDVVLAAVLRDFFGNVEPWRRAPNSIAAVTAVQQPVERRTSPLPPVAAVAAPATSSPEPQSEHKPSTAATATPANESIAKIDSILTQYLVSESAKQDEDDEARDDDEEDGFDQEEFQQLLAQAEALYPTPPQYM